MQGKAEKELEAINFMLQVGQKPSTVVKAIVSGPQYPSNVINTFWQLEKITGKPFLTELYASIDTIQSFIVENLKVSIGIICYTLLTTL